LDPPVIYNIINAACVSSNHASGCPISV